ncbi:MAG TPA: hypothetical protein VK919_01175 [Solirubrobacterales bacterium]|nr:hypothetical protein [Solirubrobacterales bacterium]
MIDQLAQKVADAETQLERGAALLDDQAAELVARQARIGELERVADRLSERIAARERELERVREELERLRDASERRLDSLAALAEELEDVRAGARGQATRIRLKALRDGVALTERITELSKRPAGMRERLLDALEEAIARIAADAGEVDAGKVDAGEVDTAEIGEERADSQPIPGDSNGHADREPSDVFEGLVEVEIGPLRDFSQLVGFEDAAGAIGATSQISVRRFTQGRATLDLKLAEPVELLNELERRAPFDFKVRDTRSDRLILDVDDE